MKSIKKTRITKLLIILLILCLVLNGSSIIFNSDFILESYAGSGDPPINGTTLKTWYVDGNVVRDYESLNTVDIQINNTGSMIWQNIQGTVDGDVIIRKNGSFNMSNCNIILNGNLIINGTVDFNKVTLRINGTMNGEFSIIVNQGGRFDVNGSRITTQVYSNRYKFEIYGNMTMSKCNVSRMWGEPRSWGNIHGGIQIFSNNVTISNSEIYDNYAGNEMGCGIYLNNAYAKIIGNTIEKNDNGIVIVGTSGAIIKKNNIITSTERGVLMVGLLDVKIENNYVFNNKWEGIIVQGNVNSKVIISNNTITKNTGTGGCGIALSQTKATIINNTITDNVGYGIHIYEGRVNVIDCVIDKHNNGLYLLKNSNCSVANSTFLRCTRDVNLFTGSHAVLLNSSFNKSRLGIDSQCSVTVQWHLNVKVENMNGNPIQNASIITKDGNDNFVAKTKTGKNGWARYINCTEYIKTSTSEDHSMDNHNVEAQVLNMNKNKNVKMTSTKNEFFNFHIPPEWKKIPEVHILEDTDKQNCMKLDDYIVDKGVVYDNLVFSIVDQTNKSKIKVSIDNENCIDITTTMENFCGSSNITVQVSDGQAFSNTNFLVIVDPVNDKPKILNEDDLIASEDMKFEVVFVGTDVDKDDTLAWTFDTNASWLRWGSNNQTIFGTPGNDDVGEYWVKINVSDNNGGYDENNILLTVINTNDPPMITTVDITDIFEDELYEVTYYATDIDLGDNLAWIFESNASWLNWGSENHTLYGRPRNDDVGIFWVKVTVSDNNEGIDIHDFQLNVVNTNDPPGLKKLLNDFSIMEDSINYNLNLNDYFEDIDRDSLSYRYSGSENILVTILDNSTIKLEPKTDWCGSESLTFYGNDSEFEISDDVTIEVIPINDPPTDPEISLLDMKYYENGYQPAVGNATDVDIPYGDELEFKWFTNSSDLIGVGKEINLSLPKGNHELSLRVIDKQGKWCSTSVELEILQDPNIDNTSNNKPEESNDISKEENTWNIGSIFMVSGIIIIVVILIIVFLIFKRKKREEPYVNPDIYQTPSEIESKPYPMPAYLPQSPQPVQDFTQTQQEVKMIPQIGTEPGQVNTAAIPLATPMYSDVPKLPGTIQSVPLEKNLEEAQDSQAHSEISIPEKIPTNGNNPTIQQENSIQEETAQTTSSFLCSACGQSLTYYSQNNKYYCHQCKKYE